ncbi:hypothetical protein ACH4RA_21130 [Streptomyces smyrnaeus]|uniref:hypothetical protein n=1 Tax=Streptomyces TaxID=1883 RepID=UPI000C1A48C9|nr:hypothetical protein [Streptomyces sp. RK75]MBQ0862748.1 hypothetical protein [Streptomyces sp. RK75]MBQ1158247.1 hypothetical protein [Streptomyces sp. A73]
MAESRHENPTLAELRDAEETCERLRVALVGADIVLPSLRVDLASCVDAANSTLRGPLLELGGCNLATAEKLAKALCAPHAR